MSVGFKKSKSPFEFIRNDFLDAVERLLKV